MLLLVERARLTPPPPPLSLLRYEGTVKDNLSFGVLEPAISKIKSLRFATEAAITILRIDDMIKLAKKEEGDPRGGR